MSTYLVTGAASFLGSHLVEELVRRGEPVRVLDRSPSLLAGRVGVGSPPPSGRT